MALFGTIRDAAMQIGVAQELVNNVVTQQIGYYKVVLPDRKSTRLNSSHEWISRMPSSA